jgi:hypothetical protein
MSLQTEALNTTETGPDNDRALRSAVLRNRVNEIEALVKAGADPNTTSNSNPQNPKETLLTYAARHGNDQMIVALMKAGADPNSNRDVIAGAPLFEAIMSAKPSTINTLLTSGKINPDVMINVPGPVGIISTRDFALACAVFPHLGTSPPIIENVMEVIKLKPDIHRISPFVDYAMKTGNLEVGVALADYMQQRLAAGIETTSTYNSWMKRAIVNAPEGSELETLLKQEYAGKKANGSTFDTADATEQFRTQARIDNPTVAAQPAALKM